jgi:predicted Zn finger-like uncharacterized protein
MRIVCPSCEAAYEVRESLLRPGRATRCVQCGHQWVPVEVPTTVGTPPPRAEPVPPSPDLPPIIEWEQEPEFSPRVPTALDRLSAASTPPARSWALRLAWVASIAALIALGAVLYGERAAVVALWPPSLRLYAVLGVAPGVESPHR